MFNIDLMNTNHEVPPITVNSKAHTFSVAPSEGRTGETKAVPRVRDAAVGLGIQVWLQDGGGGDQPLGHTCLPCSDTQTMWVEKTPHFPPGALSSLQPSYFIIFSQPQLSGLQKW